MRPRDDAPDALWHVTSRVNWQVWHLAPDEAFAVFRRCLTESLECFGVDALAAIVMSNHFHAVLRSPGRALYRKLTGRLTPCRHFRPWRPDHPKSTVIGQCVRAFKLRVSKEIQAELGLEGHFWDGKHHRTRLLDPTALVVAVAYDHRNPVRAGIVARPELYPRSTASWWTAGTYSIVPVCTRADPPFDLSGDELRSRVCDYQADKRVDDLWECFGKSRLRVDSPAGYAHFTKLACEAGLTVETAARLPHLR